MKYISLLCLFLPIALSAQGASTGSSQLLLPFHARTASLSNAVVASGESFSSALVNPAALATETETELLLSHSEWIQDIQSEFIGTRLPFRYGTLGVSIANINVGGIELRQRPGPADGTFIARFTAFQLGYAGNVSSDLSLGGTVKYLYEKLFVDEANGYALDLGAIYQTPIAGLSAGVAWTNIGTMNAFRQVSSRLPQQIQVGVAYKTTEGDFDLLPSLDIASKQYFPLSLLLGLEVRYQSIVSFRAGYRSSSDIRGFSAGAGIHYEFVKLDYAYVPFSLGFGSAHLISLGFVL